MHESYSVWTHNTDPEWLKTNDGATDMILASGLERYNANFLVHRLQFVKPGSMFFIRDGKDVIIPVIDEEDAYRVLVQEPRRRVIGMAP